MAPPKAFQKRNRRRGFTLLELLVSLVILVMAMTIVYQTFTNTMGAWERGSKVLDNLHSGDYVMQQIVTALRSAAYFTSVEGAYGFVMDSSGGAYPQDEFSWVTSGSALIPPESPLANSVYRVKVGMDNNDDGDEAVTVWAWPHLAEDGEDDAEPFYISTRVKGIDVRTYNFEEETWDDEWEDTNSLPTLVELTLFMDPVEKYGKPIELVRLVEIPLAPAITSAVINAGSSSSAGPARSSPAASPPPGGAP